MRLDATILRKDARRDGYAWALCRRCRRFVEQLEIYLDWDRRTGERHMLLRAVCCGGSQVIPVTPHGQARLIVSQGYAWTHKDNNLVHEMVAVMGNVGLTSCAHEVSIDYGHCYPPTRLDAASNVVTCLACLGTTETSMPEAA